MQDKEKKTEVTPQKNTTELLPLVALRGVVAYPKLALDFEVGRAESQKAVEAAIAADRRILLVAQKDQSLRNPAASDLYTIGVLAEIQQVMRAHGSMRVLVICRSRIRTVAHSATIRCAVYRVKNRLCRSTAPRISRWNNFSVFLHFSLAFSVAFLYNEC